ncbi:thiolase family protein [Sansalvadorimonas sp. 2012CJ34-2]|uniref:propanoyl-CoA C-acyltransferase n=1 Tax=Parendozoicomonas callyspongiae TaxID=2942213 RepID=A0ABT0PKL6_9GAMM|nr:thiolase family protein [Sansalvadorimonas sp. 2012CJ34-2]MCL6271920.1 thiolase family protein [Sansalvadorimonas sp. 2012CJ34-2]
MTDVFVVGIASTALGKFPEKSVKDFTREAVHGALKDAGASISDIEAAWFSNTRQGALEGQNTIRGQCALRPLGIQGIPVTNVENACASSSSASLQAVAHIKAGFCDVALVASGEKMFFPEKREAMFKAFSGGTDIHRLEEFRQKITTMGQDLIPEQFQNIDTGQRSFFMDSYAAQARLHMETFGTTQKQIAAVASKNHWHSTFNHLAQYQHAVTVEEVLKERLVSWPLTLPMCAPISDGGAAAIICSEKALPRFMKKRAVRIRGISLVSGTDRQPEDFQNHIGRLASLKAYEQAQIDAKDVDLAEVHDATAFSEIQQIENLGLCPSGEGGALSEQGHTSLGGKVPVNTSGGLVSKGHPVGATGIIQLFELVTQLRGEAGKRQVENARIAVAENGGGFYECEEAATVVTVLEGGRSNG